VRAPGRHLAHPGHVGGDDDGVHGLLVETLLADDLAEKLAVLLADPGRGRAMGEAGRRRVEERYGLRKVAGELIRLYEDLVAAG